MDDTLQAPLRILLHAVCNAIWSNRMRLTKLSCAFIYTRPVVSNYVELRASDSPLDDTDSDTHTQVHSEPFHTCPLSI